MNVELLKRILSSIVIVPTVLFFAIKGSIYFLLFLIVLFIASSYEWGKLSRNFSLIRIIGIIILLLSFSSAYFLREKFGLYFFLFIILICISTDVGGYLFGKIFKGPKLTKISPKKTYSGVAGSFTMPTCISFFLIENNFNLYSNDNSYLVENLYTIDLDFNLLTISIILIISFISQVGDLIVSYFKRQANVKDTGKILPGHGGILDRIDGMIFAFPFSYIILSINIL